MQAQAIIDAVALFLPIPTLSAILLLIIANVLTRVVAAVRLGVFEFERLAEFYLTRIIPYLGGYIIVYALSQVIVLYFGDSSAVVREVVSALDVVFADYAAPGVIVLSIIPRIVRALEIIFDTSDDEFLNPPTDGDTINDGR